MKSVFATVALATAAAAAPTVTLYTATSAFPAALPPECSGMSLNAVKSPVTDKVVFQTIAGATDEAAAKACVTALNTPDVQVTVLPATDPTYLCANDDADAVVPGAAAACPLATGAACTATTFCNAPVDKCKDAKCTAVVYGVAQITSKANNFVFFEMEGVEVDSSLPQLKTAQAAITCATGTAPKAVGAGWIAAKDGKKYVNNVAMDQDCIADVKAALDASYKTASNDKNTISVDKVEAKEMAPFEACVKGEGYGCAAEVKDCTAIKCQVGVECTDNAQCGANKCAVVTKDATVKVCSGSALASTMMAVGAAVVAAMLF